eukprot:7328723-Lingulodinium_polyedra.AAC.1
MLGVQAAGGRHSGLEGQELLMEGLQLLALLLKHTLQGGGDAARASGGEQGREGDAQQPGCHGSLPADQGA